MKIETEIPDINREEVIEAMARQLLGGMHDEYDAETGPYSDYRPTKLGASMKKYLDDKIEGLTQTLVREKFDATIQARIESAVDAVLAEGWMKTDALFEPHLRTTRRPVLVGELLNERSTWGDRARRIDDIAKKHIEAALSGEFKKEVDAAVKSLRTQLDAAVSDKFVAAIKQAMGVK